jgi:hypothetical protein
MAPPTNRVVNWRACITGLLLMPFAIISADFLGSILVPQEPGNWKSHHQLSPTRVEDIDTARRCPVPQRDRPRQCCHHLSAMQPSARCLTPWLRWTRALFAALRRPPPSATRALWVGFWRKETDLVSTYDILNTGIQPQYYWEQQAGTLQCVFWDTSCGKYICT